MSAANENLARLSHVVTAGRFLAPAHVVFGVRYRHAEAGRVEATMPAAAAADDDGVLDPTALLVLADALLGSSVATALPDGRTITTLSIHARCTAARVDPASTLVGVGELAGHDDESGTSRAVVRDADGTTLAELTTRCAVLNGTFRPVVELPDEPSDPRSWTDDVRETEAGPDSARVTTRSRPEWANLGGRMQGGVAAAVAGRALRALRTSRAADAPAATDLAVTFVAPVPADGREVVATARRTYGGRSFTVATAEVSVDGRPAVLVHESRFARPR